MGGGIFLGLVTAALRRPFEPLAPGVAPPPLDPAFQRRIEELAGAVTNLQQRFDTAEQHRSAGPPEGQPQAVTERLNEVSSRIEQLERRVEQLVSETPSLPPIDQVLAAVEHMVAVKIAGLDERLTDQVHAIELLRSASSQTDALLQKLITAVEALADQTAERMEAAEQGPAGAPAAGAPAVHQRDYPIA